MLKKTLMALAMVGMAATPALADLLIPDATRSPAYVGGGGIGIWAASVNGSPAASPGFLGGGGTASQVSIPANVSDTIILTFAFHWPFDNGNAPYSSALPYLGVQFQTRMEYDNSEVRILGATAAPGWTAVNFGFGASGNKMTANSSTATTLGVSGTPLKGFPDSSSGTINTAPAFGRFAIDPPNTTTYPIRDGGIGESVSGMRIPFSSTFPIMKVTLHIKNVNNDGFVDFLLPATSAAMLFHTVRTAFSYPYTDPFGMSGSSTTTFTSAGPLTYSTGGALADVANGGTHGIDVVPEPASAALLSIGLFSLAGGAWRRRRRFADVG